MGVRRGLSPLERWAPVGIAAVLVLAGVGAATASRHIARTNRLRLARATAAASAQTILAVVRGDQAELAIAGAVLEGRLDQSDAALRDALASIQSDPAVTAGIATSGRDGITRLRPLVGPLAAQPPIDLSARPEWRLAFALSRDDGLARTVAAAGAGAPLLVLTEVPIYASGAVHDSADSRRQALAGFAAALEPPDALAQPSFSSSASEVGAELVQGDTVLTASPGASRRAVADATAVASLDDPRLDWSVAAWPRRSRALLPWELLLGGLALGALAAAAAVGVQRANRRTASAADERERELQLIARIGPLLQRSLNVADVLPQLVVELDDAFALDAIVISRVGPKGDLVQTFAGGAPIEVPRWPAELDIVPSRVPAGGVLNLALQRGGRAIGALSARARHGLASSQVHVLRTVADLLSAALSNARLFAQEQEMVGRLRDVDRMKTTFLGSVSHELRTTVTAIQGFADLLSAPDLTDDERSDFLARINRNAKSMGVLVNDLLDFARLDRQSLAVFPQPVNLSELVPSIAEQTSSILGDHPVAITTSPNVVARADPSAVERILVNLLSNAAKYTPEGTSVEVDVRKVGGAAVLSVSDHGPGIPAEERERVFDRFYRLDNAETRSTRGIGIGLALVLELTKLLDGSISVEDAPGGGTRFTVELPLVGDDTGSAAPGQLLPT